MKIFKGLFLWASALFMSTVGWAQESREPSLQQTTDSLPLPEGMLYAEVDSLLHDWNVRHFLIEDSVCLSTNENPLFSDEEYVHRLSRLPNVIEMPYNAVVRQYIDRYCVSMRRTVSLMLGAINFYTPLFEEALESYQLPLELKYLPVIESALNPRATSRAGAAGLWQFMPATGKQYGLQINSLVDERKDPVKSTYAAVRYLRDLYEMFGDWSLVLASYNCGPNNVLKAIKRADGERDYWKIYPYLPTETRGYVPAFIAANYVMNYYCQHNICPLKANLPESTDTIQVVQPVYMEQLVDLCGASMQELQSLNPQYRTTLIPADTLSPCAIRMPSTVLSAFLEQEEKVYTHRLSELSKRRTRVDVPVASQKTSKSRTQTIRVKQGETLGTIARRHGTTVAKLRRLNNLKGSQIRVGQRLRVR